MLDTLDTESIIEGIPHPAMILNEDFHIVGMNRLMEAMTGHGRQESYGLHGELIIRSNVGNVRGQLYQEVAQNRQPLSVRGDILNAQRRKLPVQYSIAPLFNDKKKYTGLLVSVEDLSVYAEQLGMEEGQSYSSEIIGYSPKMQAVFDLIPLMAQTDASVLITGETGTGKDKIAETIHKKSARSRYPFIKVNCGALPADLLESELFGHVKGAFTGASRDKLGMFSLADGGTLFLTEIGDMPLALQVKLLSVLDDKEFIPVGGEKKIRVDVRIIAATHRPLRQQMQEKTFREDLFYRLHVLHVHLPPLREREGDVRYLLDHFLQIFTKALGKSIVGFEEKALSQILSYSYPGNIRELKNIVEYAANVCRKKKITLEDLPPYILEKQGIAHIEESPIKTASPVIAAPQEDEGKTWEEIERQLLVDHLKEMGGNRNKTAESLNWSRMKLWRKMKYYGLL